MEEVNLCSLAVKHTEATSSCPHTTQWALFIHIHTQKDQYSFCNLFSVLLSPPLLILSALLSTVEPKVFVSAGPAALLDGGNESLVATCIAERGRPAAEVFWETELHGRSAMESRDEPNSTTTVHVRYMWPPQSYDQGKTLTCVVRHPALQTEFRIPYTLNVQCKCWTIRPPSFLSYIWSDKSGAIQVFFVNDWSLMIRS